jgi:hypothetical protein
MTAKKKRLSLSSKDKVELRTRLDKCAKLLYDEDGVGSSTIYDLKKQKENL